MELNKSQRIIVNAYQKGYYSDSSGAIYNKKGKKLVLTLDARSYYRFSIKFDEETKSKSLPVHRFIAYEKYKESVFEVGIQVRHLNNNSADNSHDNIAIGTASDNYHDSTKETREKRLESAARITRKLTKEQVKEIRELNDSGIGYGKLAKKFNVSKTNIAYVCEGRTYKTF